MTTPANPDMSQDIPMPEIVESDAIPEGTFIVGDFSEFRHAAREGRPINPKAFVLVRMDAEADEA